MRFPTQVRDFSKLSEVLKEESAVLEQMWNHVHAAKTQNNSLWAACDVKQAGEFAADSLRALANYKLTADKSK